MSQVDSTINTTIVVVPFNYFSLLRFMFSINARTLRYDNSVCKCFLGNFRILNNILEFCKKKKIKNRHFVDKKAQILNNFFIIWLIFEV